MRDTKVRAILPSTSGPFISREILCSSDIMREGLVVLFRKSKYYSGTREGIEHESANHRCPPNRPVAPVISTFMLDSFPCSRVIFRLAEQYNKSFPHYIRRAKDFSRDEQP